MTAHYYIIVQTNTKCKFGTTVPLLNFVYDCVLDKAMLLNRPVVAGVGDRGVQF